MTIAQCEGRMRNASGKAGKMVKGARAMRPRKKREAKVRKGTYLIGANCKAARTHAKHTRHILHVKKGRGVEGNVFDSGQLHGHNRMHGHRCWLLLGCTYCAAWLCHVGSLRRML